MANYKSITMKYKQFIFPMLVTILSFSTLEVMGQTEEVITSPPVEEENEEVEMFMPPPIEKAQFPGGNDAMFEYIQKNLNYPEKSVEGKVTLRFMVGKNGEIENVHVLEGIVPGCPECQQEAIRVVESMPKWKPAMNGGKAVRSYFNLPISFKTSQDTENNK